MNIQIHQSHLLALLATSLIPLEDYLFLKLYKYFRYYRDFKKNSLQHSNLTNIKWHDDIILLNENNCDNEQIDYSLKLKIKTLKEMIYDPFHKNYVFLFPFTTVGSFFFPFATISISLLYMTLKPILCLAELNAMKRKQFSGNRNDHYKQLTLKYIMLFLSFSTVIFPYKKYVEIKSQNLLTPSKEMELFYNNLK